MSRDMDEGAAPCACDDCVPAGMHHVAWDEEDDEMMSSYSDYGTYSDYDYDDQYDQYDQYDDEWDDDEDDEMVIQFTKVLVTPQASRKSLLSLELEESEGEMSSDSSDDSEEGGAGADDGVVCVHITLLHAPRGVAVHQRVATRRGVDAQTLIYLLLSAVEMHMWQDQEYVLLLADEHGVVQPYSEALACDVLAGTQPELGHFVLARRRDLCRVDSVVQVGAHPHLHGAAPIGAAVGSSADADGGMEAGSSGGARSIKDITGARITPKQARGFGGLLRRIFERV